MNLSELQRTDASKEPLCSHCGERDGATAELGKLRELWDQCIDMQKASAAELADKMDRLFLEFCSTRKGV